MPVYVKNTIFVVCFRGVSDVRQLIFSKLVASASCDMDELISFCGQKVYGHGQSMTRYN